MSKTQLTSEQKELLTRLSCYVSVLEKLGGHFNALMLRLNDRYWELKEANYKTYDKVPLGSNYSYTQADIDRLVKLSTRSKDNKTIGAVKKYKEENNEANDDLIFIGIQTKVLELLIKQDHDKIINYCTSGFYLLKLNTLELIVNPIEISKHHDAEWPIMTFNVDTLSLGVVYGMEVNTYKRYIKSIEAEQTNNNII